MNPYVESATENNPGKTYRFFKVSGIVFCSVLGIVVLLFLGIYFFLNYLYVDTLYDDSVTIIDCNDPYATYLPSPEELSPVFVDISIKKATTEYSIMASEDTRNHFTEDIKVIAKYSHGNEIYEEELTDYEIIFDDNIFEAEGKKSITVTLNDIEALGLRVSANAEIPIKILKTEEVNPNSPFDSTLNSNSVSISYDSSSLDAWDKIYNEENYEKITTDIPFVVIRKRQYGLEGEQEVYQKTGYGSSNLYINDLHAGEKILLIDDVVSTGGTLVALLETLKDLGLEIKSAVAVIEKGKDKEFVEKETGIEVLSIVKLDIIDGKVVIEKTIED